MLFIELMCDGKVAVPVHLCLHTFRSMLSFIIIGESVLDKEQVVYNRW